MLGGSDLALADHALVPGLLAPDRDDLGDGTAVVGHRHGHAGGLHLAVDLPGSLTDLAQTHASGSRGRGHAHRIHDIRVAAGIPSEQPAHEPISSRNRTDLDAGANRQAAR